MTIIAAMSMALSVWPFSDRMSAFVWRNWTIVPKERIAEAKRLGIHGKETTPFLLAKIKDITGGDSLASNIQLVLNNAKLAAKTAACL